MLLDCRATCDIDNSCQTIQSRILTAPGDNQVSDRNPSFCSVRDITGPFRGVVSFLGFKHDRKLALRALAVSANQTDVHAVFAGYGHNPSIAVYDLRHSIVG